MKYLDPQFAQPLHAFTACTAFIMYKSRAQLGSEGSNAVLLSFKSHVHYYYIASAIDLQPQEKAQNFCRSYGQFARSVPPRQ